MCGENLIGLGSDLAATGSSPRVRGKRGAAAVVPGHPRLIPACAGKTPRREAREGGVRAHPRVCGENPVRVILQMAMLGSSPRVRGKRHRRMERRAGGGLIPACAGKTSWGPSKPPSCRAHPRVCGENSGRTKENYNYTGSSPRVRGKRLHRKPPELRRRLIPACAGKTPRAPLAARWRGAHPRVCGENGFTSAAAAASVGSSPRVRGKRLPGCRCALVVGLIPACAGKTSAPGPRPPRSPAHPRVCGENPRRCASRSRITGSSPRVRGKRPRPHWRGTMRGLIPACAGKTHTEGTWCPHRSAHPRVCGENTS